MNKEEQEIKHIQIFMCHLIKFCSLGLISCNCVDTYQKKLSQRQEQLENKIRKDKENAK